MTALYAKYNAV